ncbi:hypothetical protein BUL40_07175 [Croceivirga radicis]|uniref:Sulfatase N-terminal domain-containing protein n=1 Tax=Croceivirga radicis TaxID=1929488 RepID=A0A1V6LRU4_9FLAO|nr:sulfatase-like hydrolase/transferase [Croceivirga radicis]OQD42868.1 hypothetical protein BUL40_07175 [Croceivirga radicis]
MQVKANIKKIRTLKDYTRLYLGFAISLIVLGIYQQIQLYDQGVIATVFNRAFYILFVNQLGFASIVAFIFLFAFRFFEKRKPGLGYRLSMVFYGILLFLEAILVLYFVKNYSLLSYDALNEGFNLTLTLNNIFHFLVLMVILVGSYVLSYKFASRLNAILGHLYPYIFFLLVFIIGSLFVEKNYINENKTQYLFANKIKEVLDLNTYKGEKEFPLLKPSLQNHELSQFIKQNNKPPNIFIIILDGIPKSLTDATDPMAVFMPNLVEMTKVSVQWQNFYSNGTEINDAVTNITGSLPYGYNGFSMLPQTINRNTLYGFLKKNGYRSYFHYGGNLGISGLDTYLKQERVDVVLDKSKFGPNYKLQLADRAGVSLGYPDGELYRKWASSYQIPNTPKIELLVNLSSQKPFNFPDKEKFIAQVEKISLNPNFSRQVQKQIQKNKAYFASLPYVDQQLQKFINLHKETNEHQNTLFVVTSTANKYLPSENAIERHHVPFFLYGPLIKNPQVITTVASHQDVAPSLLGYLEENYNIKTAPQVTWLGSGLLKDKKDFALHNKKGYLEDFYSNGYFLLDDQLVKVESKGELQPIENTTEAQRVKSRFKAYKAVSKYVTTHDKLLPKELAIFPADNKVFSDADLVYINSVFSGLDYDKGYQTAKELAHSGNLEGALLLANYILHKVPGHVDAKILKGRIFSWSKRYYDSIELLEQVVELYPQYEDGYAALLDVYYWSGNNHRAAFLADKLKENRVGSDDLDFKLKRCNQQIKALSSL